MAFSDTSLVGDVYGYLPTEPQRRAGGYEVDGYFSAVGLHTRARPDGERHIPSTRGACQSSRVTAFQPSNDAFSGPELVCSWGSREWENRGS